MKRVVFLGSGEETVEEIERLRALPEEVEITLIPFDGTLPYYKRLLPDRIRQGGAGKGLFCRDKRFYQEHKVRLMTDRGIQRLNTRRGYLVLDDKTRVEYDVLVLTDVPGYHAISLKGKNKTGWYGCQTLKMVEDIRQALPWTETAVVQSERFDGIRLAGALLSLGKETILMVPRIRVLQEGLSADQKGHLEGLVDQGLRVFADQSVTELLGDQRVKAVRLATGKILAAEMVVIDGLEPDWSLFMKAGIALDPQQGVLVDEKGLTNQPCVYAIGPIAVRPREQEKNELRNSIF